MALIGKIRRNPILLFFMIGLALIAFLFMDWNSLGNRGQTSQTIMGKVGDRNMDYLEFNNAERVLGLGGSGNDVFEQRNTLWNYFVEKMMVEDEAESMGISVSDDEMEELQFGPNYSPIVQSRYANPQTRQIDPGQISQIRQTLESTDAQTAQFRNYWDYQKTEIKKDRLQSKIGGMIDKAIYAPSWMAEAYGTDQSSNVDFQYVRVPFDNISDDQVEVSDADLNAYLSSNIANYTRDEELRRADYIVFDVVPTSGDSAIVKDNMAALCEEFRTTDNDSLFLISNYSVYDNSYNKASILPPNIKSMVENMQPGEVYGPYLEGKNYVGLKLIDNKNIPDSVRSRHILIGVNNGDQAGLISANSRIDSIKTAIESGTANFDAMAKRFSTGPSGPTGGDLGYSALNATVKPYNDVLFYTGEQGKLYKIFTQFGVHLVEILGKKRGANEMGYKLGLIREAIIPSDETQDELLNKADQIASDYTTYQELKAAADADPSIIMLSSTDVKANDFNFANMGKGQTSRDLVKWMFDGSTDLGGVSDVYIYENAEDYYNSNYVIATLTDILPAGRSSLSEVRDQITPFVRLEKKGALLQEAMAGFNLAKAARKYKVDVDSISGVRFTDLSPAGLGAEPNVIASAFKLEAGQLSEPVIGESGVYIVKTNAKNTAASGANVGTLRTQSSSRMKNSIYGNLMNTWKKLKNVEDERSKFF